MKYGKVEDHIGLNDDTKLCLKTLIGKDVTPESLKLLLGVENGPIAIQYVKETDEIRVTDVHDW